MVATYKYDDTGLRTEKAVTENGVTTTTKFVYNSGKLIAEYTGTSRVDYLYDENSMLYGFIYDNAKYFYIRDTLQNILGIVDANGDAVVHYDYTAYGECTEISGSMANTIGAINSFRYKGYYFDNETEFFYCKSRFYLPQWCRWLNCDNYVYLTKQSIVAFNLLVYCNNSPVIQIDSSGKFAVLACTIAILKVIKVVVTVVAIVSAVAAVASVVSNVASVVDSKKYVEECDVEPMEEDRYKEINDNNFTYGLTKEEKLAYIRAYRNDATKDSSDWSEAEMLREFAYHDRGYELSVFFGSDPDVERSKAYRFKYVNFEEEQTWKTYLYRYVGNCMFW